MELTRLEDAIGLVLVLENLRKKGRAGRLGKFINQLVWSMLNV